MESARFRPGPLLVRLKERFWLHVHRFIELYEVPGTIDTAILRAFFELYMGEPQNLGDGFSTADTLIATFVSAIILMELALIPREQTEAWRSIDWKQLQKHIEENMEEQKTRQQNLQDQNKDIIDRLDALFRLLETRDRGGEGRPLIPDDRLDWILAATTRLEELAGGFTGTDHQALGGQTTVCGALAATHGLVQRVPRRAANIVCSEVVGESYYRWDKSVHYFPTLELIFTDPLSEAPVRRTQLKLRLTRHLNPLTEEDITALQTRCVQALSGGLSYRTGQVRCNYVSPHPCKWKTTVFAVSVEDADRILRVGCALIEEEYVADQLSYTQGRNLRDPSSTPRLGWDGRLMTIRKAALLMKGAPHPIVLFLPSQVDD